MNHLIIVNGSDKFYTLLTDQFKDILDDNFSGKSIIDKSK